MSGRLFSFPRPSITLHSPLNEAPKAASGSEGGTSERPTSRRKATSGGGEWGVRGTTIGRPLTTLTPSHSAYSTCSSRSLRSLVSRSGMDGENEGRKGIVSDRPSPAVHSLTSSSCHRPKDGPEGGVTRGRGREESEPSDVRRIAHHLFPPHSSRSVSYPLPFPFRSLRSRTVREENVENGP